MTRTASLLVLAVAVALPLAAAGCGGSDQGAEPSAAGSPTAIEADFLQQADDVCAPYAAYSAHHLLRVSGFSRLAPQPELLPRVAAYLAQNPAYRTLVADLQDLGEPSGGADGWDTVLSDLTAGQQAVQAEVQAARARDPDAFVTAEDERAQSNAGLHADMLAAGLPGDSSCLAAQTDPLQTTPFGH